MPIRPEFRHLYAGPEWTAIRERIIVERAKRRCEHCKREHGQPYINKRNKWVTVQIGCAHLDHNPYNQAEENLAALCRGCHLAHDLHEHVAASRDTRMERKDAARPLLSEARNVTPPAKLDPAALVPGQRVRIVRIVEVRDGE